MPKCIHADTLLAACRKEKRQPSAAEKALIDEAEAMRETIIQVDSFQRLGRELHLSQEWTASERPGVTAGVAAMARAQL